MEQAHRLADRAHTQFTVSISLFLAGLFGFAASLLMYSFNQDAYILPLLLTLAAVSAGVVLILLHSRSSSALTNLLAEYSVDSPEELEQLFLALPPDESSDVPEPEDLPVPDDPSDAENPLLTQAQEHFDAALDAVRELCRTAGIAESSDIGDTLQALRKAADDIRADRETMADKLANLTGKLEVLNEQLADIDRNQAEADYREALEHPFGKTADALTAADIKSLMKERDFTAGALRSAEKRRLDLETQLAALGSPANPEETATALDELDRRIEELSLRHDACELAKNALLTASDNLRSGVIPKIAANASILLSGATSGTHETLTLDSALNAGCSTDADILSGEHLSRGTSDLAYLALRVALAEEIFKTETPFLLFDESFSHIDSARIRGMVSLLLDGQHLILTCRREEAEAAESAGAAILRL